MNPYREEPPCDHGVTFDDVAARAIENANRKLGTPELTTPEIRANWPRLDGECPKGCGYVGIAYASVSHYLWGDW